MAALRARLTAITRAPIGSGAYRVVTLVALVSLGAIVVSGAAVRLTGSGMGCPTWPACETDSLVPKGATGSHGWIEFLNRVFTGGVSLAVGLAVLGSRRRVPRRDDLTRLSWMLVGGVFAQALLGGLVVILHVAPIAVAGHYLVSAVLVAIAVLLHHRASEPPGARRPAATDQLLAWSKRMVGLTAVVLISGTFVTGSGPHGGDEAADRLPFDVGTVAPIHSATVWILLGIILVVLYRAEQGDASPTAIGRGRLLVGVVVAQGSLGYLQYFTGVPEGLVGLHVLGSVLVWSAVLRFHLALTEPVPGVDGAEHLDPTEAVVNG